MTIEISNLTFKCIIGILPKERVKKQKVIIDICFDYEYKENTFIDYSKITAQIKKMMKKKKFELIEEALLCIKKELTSTYAISNLNLKITKPTILHNCHVAVSTK